MAKFKQYARIGLSEMVPWSEDLDIDISRLSISPADKDAGSPKVGDMIARNPKSHDDIWLVSASYFQDNLEEVRYTFGWAVEQLKQGKKVARKGWNGKGMYLAIINSHESNLATHIFDNAILEPADPEEYEDSADLNRFESYICMLTVQHTLVPWLASQSDVLAEDWQIAED